VVVSRSMEIERTEKKNMQGSSPLYLDKELAKHLLSNFLETRKRRSELLNKNKWFIKERYIL